MGTRTCSSIDAAPSTPRRLLVAGALPLPSHEAGLLHSGARCCQRADQELKYLANDTNKQALIGHMRAMRADGMSFARITDQRGAAKVPTERGGRWSAWQSRKSSTVQHEDRQGAVSALCT